MAISRVQHDRCDPAQALDRAVLTTFGELHKRGNIPTVGRTPAHAGAKGNEQADEAARYAAEEGGDRVGNGFLREASPSYLMRMTTEARSQATGTWIRDHLKRRHRYCSPPPPREASSARAVPCQKGASRPLLPAPFRTCSHG